MLARINTSGINLVNFKICHAVKEEKDCGWKDQVSFFTGFLVIVA